MRTLIVLSVLSMCLAAAFAECPPRYFECDNGNCVRESYVCDGDNDCGDRSDEPDTCPPCPIGRWQCANGDCVSATWICDGDNDCGDWSDERDPVTGQCPTCPDSHFQCLTGQCSAKANVCNGINDCGDWSDETEEACPCADNEVRCSKLEEGAPPGACIPPEWICDEDGIRDCPGGDDEANCTVRAVGTRHSKTRRSQFKLIH